MKRKLPPELDNIDLEPMIKTIPSLSDILLRRQLSKMKIQKDSTSFDSLNRFYYDKFNLHSCSVIGNVSGNVNGTMKDKEEMLLENDSFSIDEDDIDEKDQEKEKIPKIILENQTPSIQGFTLNPEHAQLQLYKSPIFNLVSVDEEDHDYSHSFNCEFIKYPTSETFMDIDLVQFS